MIDDKELFDAGVELGLLFFFSCGVAWIFRRRLKGIYKGRDRRQRILNDVINCICTGMFSVFAAVLLAVAWPEMAPLKMQICLCGLFSGYGLSFINRVLKYKLGLRNVDMNDDKDIEEVRKEREKGRDQE